MKVIEEKTKAHESLCSNTLYGLCKSAQEIPALEIYNSWHCPLQKEVRRYRLDIRIEEISN